MSPPAPAKKNPKKVQKIVINGTTALRMELDDFCSQIDELKVKYELYFTGILPLPPDKEYTQLRLKLRNLQKAPFKNSSLAYRLKTLENRYKTYDTYWKRVLRAKEDGTYHKDIFKAELREKNEAEDRRAQTQIGISEKHMQGLFQSYKGALEKHSGKTVPLDFNVFQRSISDRVRELQGGNSSKKIAFSVVVRDGQVTLRAKVKDGSVPSNG